MITSLRDQPRSTSPRALLAVLALLAALLTGCGGATEPASPAPSSDVGQDDDVEGAEQGSGEEQEQEQEESSGDDG